MRFVVSLHAAKAGGTSFGRYLLDDISPGFPVFCHYGVGHHLHGLHWRGQISHREALVGDTSLDQVLSHTNTTSTLIVHGHLTMSQVEIHRAHNPEVLVWLRDPIERIRSHFDYWRLSATRTAPANQALLDAVKDGSCSIEEFGTHVQIANYYQWILGDHDIASLGAVGIVEHANESLRSIARWLSVPDPVAFPHLNRTDGSETRVELAAATRAAIAEANAGDVALYEAGLGRHFASR